jgi:hypothetical protein
MNDTLREGGQKQTAVVLIKIQENTGHMDFFRVIALSTGLSMYYGGIRGNFHKPIFHGRIDKLFDMCFCNTYNSLRFFPFWAPNRE